jgi:hypothetical protein
MVCVYVRVFATVELKDLYVDVEICARAHNL